MKNSRLFGIVHLLLNRERVTARDLAERFEVSTRTIYRDIDALSMSGIPIYTDRGLGGGIRLLDNYILDKTVISEAEKESILLGLEVIKATSYRSEDTLSKVSDLFNKEQSTYIEVDFSSFDCSEERQNFEMIKEGLKANNSLAINYRDSLGKLSIRQVDPLKLIFKKQRWYLVGYCHDREAYRTFRISRILNVELLASSFDRQGYDLSNYNITGHGIKNSQVIKLKLYAEARHRVEEEFHFNMIRERKDATIQLEFEAEMDEWLINYMMSFSAFLIDIEPIELKNELQNRAKKILDL